MTTAKILTNPGKGHGLVDNVTDPIYRALTKNEPTGEIVAVVVLRPKSFGATDTADGRHQHVSFEATKVEPVLDANQASELRYLLQGLYEQRTSTGQQRTLPLGLGTDRERQLALIERIEEWSAEQNMTSGELEARWREQFGIGPDQDWSMGDSGIPGDYRKAGIQRLLEFGYAVGALDSGDPQPQDDQPEDDDAADEDDSDDDTSDEEPNPGTAQVSDLPFTCEVCSKGTATLTQNLCDDCARNAGYPVLADEAVATGTDGVTPIEKKRRR